jgi:hypothetical protein
MSGDSSVTVPNDRDSILGTDTRFYARQGICPSSMAHPASNPKGGGCSLWGAVAEAKKWLLTATSVQELYLHSPIRLHGSWRVIEHKALLLCSRIQITSARTLLLLMSFSLKCTESLLKPVPEGTVSDMSKIFVHTNVWEVKNWFCFSYFRFWMLCLLRSVSYLQQMVLSAEIMQQAVN